ncbi:HAD family hydrolase [Desulfobacterium sp. N47]|uniref:phosphoglycolate phosphatase n=1 Tax=uncultured Desulfobacterium sp. TaxID=201089 RepID=E1YIW0_9BACT|nr:hypothetical protein N47_K27440 [uncultured Desulfobacterium sp.]
MLIYKNRDIRGVILDIDGTLIDSLSQYHEYFNRGLEEFALSPAPRELLFECLGMGIGLRDILRRVTSSKLEDSVIDKIAKWILAEFVKVDMDVPLLPGVVETLEFLKAEGARIGLATGRASGGAYEWERLEHVGLAAFIDVILTAVEVPNRKPAPDLIVACARGMAVAPADCIAVGDTVADIIAARAAGAIPIAVCTGVDGAEKLKTGVPAAVIDRLDEIMALFQKQRVR